MLLVAGMANGLGRLDSLKGLGLRSTCGWSYLSSHNGRWRSSTAESVAFAPETDGRTTKLPGVA